MKIKPGDTVIFKEDLSELVNEFHVRYAGQIFKVREVSDSDNSFLSAGPAVINMKRWSQDCIEKVLTKEDYPEYFL